MDKASGGKLKIQVHANASLFKAPEIKRAVQGGQAQAGEILRVNFANEDAMYEIDGIPFLATSYADSNKLYRASKKALEERNAALEDAETNLQATQVHAPVDGVIVMRKGEAGAEIQKGEDEVFRIATDLGNLQIVVEPEAAVLSRIKEGMLVAVFVAEQSNEALNGEIARVADGKVTILFLNPNPLIKPGLTAQVRIKLP